MVLIGALLLHPFQPAATATILPQGVLVEEVFSPGFGEPIGTVLLVQGPVYVVHAGLEPAYRISSQTPVFKGDTLYTDDKGRLRFKLNDDSIVTLSSNTQLTLSKSVYNPRQKKRASFLKMTLGRARFYVVKLMKFRENAFKVKTRTFVAGVRGSDFVITATSESATVAALENTTLEIVSLAAPEAKPLILTDFHRISVDLGAMPGAPEKINMDEIRSLKEEFALGEDRLGESGTGLPEKGGRSGAVGKATTPAPLGKTAVAIPPEEMVIPGSMDSPLPQRDLPTAELEKRELSTNMDEIQSEVKTIIADKREDDGSRIPELPPMPERPQ